MPCALILCEYPTLSGGERSILAMVGLLRAAGWEPHAACPGEGPLAEAFRAAGVEVAPLEWCNATGRDPSRRQRREAIAGWIGRLRPTVFHANSVAMARLSGPVVAALGQPSLAHLRDIVALSRQAVADINCHRRLLAVSRAARDYHSAAGLDAGRLHVLHNGVDLVRFRPRAATGKLHRELRLPPGARLLGTIGQIGPRKGQDILLAAAERLERRYDDVHWLIVGRRFSGKEESVAFERRLREATATGALSRRWHWLDWRDDVAELLGELTALVHPARQEPLGRVLIEAAACGVAVVATEVGGTAEIFAPLGAEPFGAREADRSARKAEQGASTTERREPPAGPTGRAPREPVEASDPEEPGPDRRSHPRRRLSDHCDTVPAALLVPPNDPPALADAVARLLDDESLRRRLGAEARRVAERRFDAAVLGARLAEHYEAVAAGGP